MITLLIPLKKLSTHQHSEQAAADLWRHLSVWRSVLQLQRLNNNPNQIQPEAVCLVCGFCTVDEYFRFISYLVSDTFPHN